MSARYLGIDMGAETLKVAEIVQEDDGTLRWGQRVLVEHHKDPTTALLTALAPLRWESVEGAAITGRIARQVDLPRIPEKQARRSGVRFLKGTEPITVVSIGAHGFSVLELRGDSPDVFRENSRCSQGTGNFLRQLTERFNLTVEEASVLAEGVEDPAPLSGRCPVILKTDMTHLANHGYARERILAGLYDAVAENAQVLIKPRLSPPRLMFAGGVSRSVRIREHFRTFAERNNMRLCPTEIEDGLFVDALGCAVLAAGEGRVDLPNLTGLFLQESESDLTVLPPLRSALDRVNHMEPPPFPSNDRARRLTLGLDIGSTGSKAVAIDVETNEAVWQGYTPTSGQPVEAARRLVQDFTDSTWATHPVVGLGATGSGREIVGSLMRSCYGGGQVFVLNEIAAHARGATHYDPRVDTIFEIGGQDAKYIRLSDGRVVDAAMNEACSAGTGSFIEEQGKRFQGIDDIVHMGQVALSADAGVSLGQHCSVFMAEIIDEAVGAGLPQPTIVAGIYDSIIQNYLNRVKGSRSVGDVIFCQGMPFTADALAAAVARQTGSEVIVPPNPGTIGALGIALLTAAEGAIGEGLDLDRFLGAQVLSRDDFICKSTRGCGGSGNKCRIDRIHTLVAGKKQRFLWGGACSLYDKGTGTHKLPDGSPDPFRERDEYVHRLLDALVQDRGLPRVALTDEFILKGMLPFFATLLDGLGFDLELHRGADPKLLKRGIEESNVPFCAPMQQFHGITSAMADGDARYLFVPMLRSLPRVKDEPLATLCPIVQGSPDVLRWDLGLQGSDRVLSPAINIGSSYRSGELEASIEAMAEGLGVTDWRPAFHRALHAQEAFDAYLLELGQTALDFAAEHGVVPVVVLGRTYTIYNRILNSNVPAILREQGALPIPVDCYPVDDDVPVYDDMYWAYGQRNLRAAHQIRRTPGIYSLWTSNYSCGPDSFNLHFYSYTMEGKPFAIIETDGHSGDAGTRTRVEAFLYTVHQDLTHDGESSRPARRSLKLIELDKEGMPDILRRGETVLIPLMGVGAQTVAAALRGIGVKAEALPMPDNEALAIGRRNTSGKECVPMTVTMGSLLQRLQGEEDTDELFTFFMPTASGPCRFGVYNMLHKIILERHGWKERVRVWSVQDSDYFRGLPKGFSVLAFIAFMGADLLLEMLYDTRPRERQEGGAEALFDRYFTELNNLMESELDAALSAGLVQVATGRLYGVTDLLRRAARDFKAMRADVDLPTVLLVGEIYVRSDSFSNDFAVAQLEARGLHVRFAPFDEWVEYVDFLNKERTQRPMAQRLTSRVQQQIQEMSYRAVAEIMGWPERTSAEGSVEAASTYIRPELEGEAVLTIGGPLHEWHAGLIDGVCSVGPLECMPSKLSEAQFFHIAEEEGLVSLSLHLNGDPVDPVVWDNFAYEVKQQYKRRRTEGATPRATPMPVNRPLWRRAARKLVDVTLPRGK